PPDDVYRDHVGIHAQRQAGTYYAGLAVLRGRLTSEQMVRVADLADRYGSGELRTTGMQNLIILNIPKRNADGLVREANDIGLHLSPSSFSRGTIACTGTEFCKLAITETKGYARWLVGELEERLPGFAQHLKIHITGCPNSCGQHWVADLGLEGKKFKVDGKMADAYYFCVSGGLGKHQATARPIGFRCQAREVPEAVERLLRGYLDGREEGENFREYCARHTEEGLRTIVAGKEVESALRDPSPGRVPHGVEG
ncbi:MAG TPA: hypothetical protein VEU07_00090, partial [Candidatus Acidoferrum sp.]|nr:hypothetical protein [Candidatus Acidoferrum sp.]